MENSYTSDTDSDLFESSYFCFLQNDFLLFFFFLYLTFFWRNWKTSVRKKRSRGDFHCSFLLIQ